MTQSKDNKETGHNFGADLSEEKLEQLAVNVIRGLSMDAIQKANSGHPGMPMGAADIAYVLWMKFLQHNPFDTSWPNRDRFVLSAGHGSMLLYSLLHLTGYAIELEDLKKFRQWGSITPGHPEYGLTPGAETTTGPLGQGFANGIGMAIAERRLAEIFNDDDFSPVDHYTYAIVSDGDLMEGISNEAASIAGFLGLGKVIYLYDSNKITIEGSTEITYTEDVAGRFKALGWHVQKIDGHDREEIEKALKRARRVKNKPSLIIAKTHIAFGSPNKRDSESSHGAPLGEEEVALSKEQLGLPVDEKFFVPEIVADHFTRRSKLLKIRGNRWKKKFENWRKKHPDKAELWDAMMSRSIPEDLAGKLPSFNVGEKIATRKASGQCLQVVADKLPGIFGGSADLGPSNKTTINNSTSVCRENFTGCNFHFGIREHAMGGILNGMSLHGGLIPYGGTFLMFSDYMRPSIRLAALMKLPVVYIFTHDSIFVGEDGPTHQPVEHLQALRIIPQMRVFRPADAEETKVAWMEALRRKDGPTALLLSRQGLPVLERSHPEDVEGVKRGAYIIKHERSYPAQLILLASGSEVHLAVEAAEKLEADGSSVRVVSIPALELFERQDAEYRDEIIPPEVMCRVSVEAARTSCWAGYVKPFGESIGMDRFGESAPYADLSENFGFTVDNVVSVARRVLDEFEEKAKKYLADLDKSVSKLD